MFEESWVGEFFDEKNVSYKRNLVYMQQCQVIMEIMDKHEMNHGEPSTPEWRAFRQVASADLALRLVDGWGPLARLALDMLIDRCDDARSFMYHLLFMELASPRLEENAGGDGYRKAPIDSVVDELQRLEFGPEQNPLPPRFVLLGPESFDGVFTREAFHSPKFGPYLKVAKVKCREYLYKYERSNNLTDHYYQEMACVGVYESGSCVAYLDFPGYRYIDSGEANWCQGGQAVLCCMKAVWAERAGTYEFSFTDDNPDPVWVSMHNLESL
jgi:hypothetical protein